MIVDLQRAQRIVDLHSQIDLRRNRLDVLTNSRVSRVQVKLHYIPVGGQYANELDLSAVPYGDLGQIMRGHFIRTTKWYLDDAIRKLNQIQEL